MKKTLQELVAMKQRKEKIVALTSYDFQTAQILDEHCDFILVGDSLGNVFQGNETTLSVELDNMIYHGQIVGKALKNAHLCVDMPFMSYQASEDTGLLNMGNVIKKTGAQSVKIEMNFSLLNLVGLASQSGIPIVAHVGLCPQSYNTYGGYKKQGKNKDERDFIYELAIESYKNGAALIVIEGVPEDLAKKITEDVSVPTIGIGAGKYTDGQILVAEDMLGITPSPRPSFVKAYSNLRESIKKAAVEFKKDVKKSKFP